MAARPALARLDVSTVAAGAGKQQLVHARRSRRPAHAHRLPVPGAGSAIRRLACSSPFLGGSNGSRRLKHNAAAGEKSAADHAAGALEDELIQKENSGDAAAGASPPSSCDNHSAPQQIEVTADTNDGDKEKTNGPARDVHIKAKLLGYNLEPGSGPHYNHLGPV
uniref:Uncharacterized protein n=1 Tax=Oryza meridionalis TaxID=40149 RepID=A0A0E0EII2_9ORYZ